jgi:hypothetical protein
MAGGAKQELESDARLARVVDALSVPAVRFPQYTEIPVEGLLGHGPLVAAGYAQDPFPSAGDVRVTAEGIG